MPAPLLAALVPYLPYLAAAGLAGTAAIGSRIAGGKGAGLKSAFGTQGEKQQFDIYDPQQKKLLDTLAQLGLTGLQGSIGQNNPQNFDFSKISQNAQNRFTNDTIPSIAQRFGNLSTKHSGPLLGALASAGSNLQSDLGALEADYGLKQQGMGLEQQKLFQNLLALGLTPQHQNAYQPGQPGFLQSGAQGVIANAPLYYQLSGISDLLKKQKGN